MDGEHRDKWDLIETHYLNGELTPLGYQTSLRQLFVETGILMNKTDPLETNKLYFESKDKCIEKVVLLEKEISDLLKRLKEAENALNKV